MLKAVRTLAGAGTRRHGLACRAHPETSRWSEGCALLKGCSARVAVELGFLRRLEKVVQTALKLPPRWR